VSSKHEDNEIGVPRYRLLSGYVSKTTQDLYIREIRRIRSYLDCRHICCSLNLTTVACFITIFQLLN